MKTRNIFIIIIISLFFSFSIKFLKFSHSTNFNNLIFLIKYEYYGIDAQQIEKLLTIPLEEELYTLENIIEIKSTSQLNQSITTVTFNSEAKYDSTYLAIRKITEHFSNSLPREVQPCKILISHTESNNIICASFNCKKIDLEKYKQQFENIPGVSEVIINGREDNNIIVEFSNLKLSNLKLTTMDIKNAVQINNQNNIAVRQTTANSITRLSFNNRIENFEDFGNINIIKDELIIPLNTISRIYYGNSSESDIFLINNSEASVLNLKMDSDANLISVSYNFNQIINKSNLSSFEPVIIFDSGKEQFKDLLIIIVLIFISLLCSGWFTYLIFRSINNSLITIIIFTICIIWTLGIFSILHISINMEIFITFIIIPVVSLIQTVFYIINSTKSHNLSYTFLFTSFIISFLIYFPPLLLKNKLTTFFSINLSFIISLISLIILIILFDPFFIKRKSHLTIVSNIFRTIRKIVRFKLTPFFITIIFSISSLLLFTVKKQNFQTSIRNNIFLQLDFNIERSASSIKKELDPFFTHLQNIENIKFIKTEISRGTCSIEIIPNLNKKKKVVQEIQNIIHSHGKENVYLQSKDSNKLIRLVIKGENIQNCESYAIETANLLKSEKEVVQVIAHFKEHEKQFHFIPDLIQLTNHNTSVTELSSALRDYIYNPVISKVFINNKETDVRIYSDQNNFISQVLTSNHLIIDDSLITLENLGKFEITFVPSKIHRLNGSRCAYLTLQMKSSNHKNIKKILKKIESLKLNEGYTVTIENTDELLKQIFNNTSFYLLISVLSIFLILTALYENIKKTLIIVLYPFSLIFLILINIMIYNFQLNYVLYEALLVILSVSMTIINEVYVKKI